jgi:hypothetical protein
MRNEYRVSVGKAEGKRPLGRFRRRCWSFEKSDGWVGTCFIWLKIKDWLWDLVNTVMNLRVP